jgi:hypothetical protein
VPGRQPDRRAGRLPRHLAALGRRAHRPGDPPVPQRKAPPGPELAVPASGLPADTTPLRIGRRSAGNDDSQKFWQFYGLVGDVGVFTKALSQAEIQQLAGSVTLTGAESCRLAGWTFATGPQPPKLSRPVTLPAAADIQDHVTPSAAQRFPSKPKLTEQCPDQCPPLLRRTSRTIPSWQRQPIRANPRALDLRQWSGRRVRDEGQRRQRNRSLLRQVRFSQISDRRLDNGFCLCDRYPVVRARSRDDLLRAVKRRAVLSGYD